jgi:hypothetical protein
MRVEASHGSLELCYDEFGRSYRTPVYCFVDPLNVIRPTTKNLVHRKLVSKKSSLSSFYNQHISLRIRINPGMFDLNIIAATSDTILDLKHLILEQSSQQVRFLQQMHVNLCEDSSKSKYLFFFDELLFMTSILLSIFISFTETIRCLQTFLSRQHWPYLSVRKSAKELCTWVKNLKMPR